MAWTFAALAALAFALLLLTSTRVAERGRFARAFSSYGSGPSGVRALYLLLSELGDRPQRWSQDLARLPADATLIALGDCDTRPSRALSRYEEEELVHFIDRGGVLLVAGARHYLPAALPVRFEFEPSCASADDEDSPADESPAPVAAADGGIGDAGIGTNSTDRNATPAPIWGVPMTETMQGLPIIPFRAPAELSVPLEAEVLFGAPKVEVDASSGELTPLAAVVARGKGRVIALASANMLQNGEIETSAGAALFSRLLKRYGGGGPVLFDEYHLGIGERRSLMQYLRQLGAMPLISQLLLCALVALWRAGARFGAIRSIEPPKEGETISFVTALGHLYESAADSAGALRLIARAALTRIATHYGAPSAQAEPLARALAELHAEPARLAVAEIVAAVSGKPTEPLPMLVQRIDRALARALASEQEPVPESRSV